MTSSAQQAGRAFGPSPEERGNLYTGSLVPDAFGFNPTRQRGKEAQRRGAVGTGETQAFSAPRSENGPAPGYPLGEGARISRSGNEFRL